MLEALRAAEQVQHTGQALQLEYEQLQTQHAALQAAHTALQAQHDEATRLALVFEAEAARMQQVVGEWEQQRCGLEGDSFGEVAGQVCASCGGTTVSQTLPVDAGGLGADASASVAAQVPVRDAGNDASDRQLEPLHDWSHAVLHTSITPVYNTPCHSKALYNTPCHSKALRAQLQQRDEQCAALAAQLADALAADAGPGGAAQQAQVQAMQVGSTSKCRLMSKCRLDKYIVGVVGHIVIAFLYASFCLTLRRPCTLSRPPLQTALERSIAATAALEAGNDGSASQLLAALKTQNEVLEAQLQDVQHHMAAAHQQWTDTMDKRARRIERLQGGGCGFVSVGVYV